VLFNKSQWGYDTLESRKSLRVCYCDIVKCIRLCCQLGHLKNTSNDCYLHEGNELEMKHEIMLSDHSLKTVNLLEDEYKHRLIHDKVSCKDSYFQDEEDSPFLHPVSF
jgi:hypothetical protein